MWYILIYLLIYDDSTYTLVNLGFQSGIHSIMAIIERIQRHLATKCVGLVCCATVRAANNRPPVAALRNRLQHAATCNRQRLLTMACIARLNCHT
jgi:hypothetical protein